MGFFQKLSGVTLFDQVHSSEVRESLQVQLLLLHIAECTRILKDLLIPEGILNYGKENFGPRLHFRNPVGFLESAWQHNSWKPIAKAERRQSFTFVVLFFLLIITTPLHNFYELD